MKRFRTLLLTLIGVLALSFGVFALAACGPKGGEETSGPETPGGTEVTIGAEYKAIYDNYYKEAAGEDAKTLEAWYADLSADIEEIGSNGEIDSLDVVTVDGTQYVAITYDNGKLWLEKLVGGERFGECVKFVLSVTDKANKSVEGLYLQVGKVGATERTNKVHTSVRGTADIYVEAGSNDIYKVYVEATSSGDYGFAIGYEPKFTVTQSEKTVPVTIMGKDEKASATAKVVYKAEDNAAKQDIHVDLVYAEGDEVEGITVAEGVSGADGKITYSYYPHKGSEYALKVNDALLPDTYEPTGGVEIPLAGTDETLITLIRKKNFAADHNYQATGEVAQAQDVTDRDIELITIPASGSFDSLVTSSENEYKYQNKQVYVALDYLMEGVHATKKISELLEGEDDFFSCDKQTDENQNTWTHFSYKQMLQAYVEKVDNNGLYPLNADLIGFVKDAAEWRLFAKGTGAELDAFLPLVTYSDEKLALGEELDDFVVNITKNTSAFNATSFRNNHTTVKLMNNIPEGWYILTASANSTKFGTGSTNYLGGCIDETDPGFTIQTASYAHTYRFFTMTKEVKSETGTVEFTAYIYLGPNTREIQFGSMAANSTDVQMKLEAVSEGVLKDAKKPIITEGTYEFPVFPASMFVNNISGIASVRLYNNFMLGNAVDTSRTYVTYTLTPEIGEIQGLKATHFQSLYESTPKTTTAAYTFSETNTSYTLNRLTINNANYVVVFTHSGSDIKTVKVAITAKYERFVVKYESGEGAVGETYSTNTVSQYQTGQTHTVLDVLEEGIGFTKEGYTFIGWHNKANEGTAVDYRPGDVITIQDSDVVLVAVWRENNVSMSDPLKLGASVTAEIDESQYTSTEIPFATEFEYNKAYKLTLNAGAEEWGGWTVMLGERTVGLILDESAGVYVAYIFPGEGDDRICILTPDGEDKRTVTVALEEYVPVELADGTEAIIPIAPEGIEGLITNLASSLAPGSYRITFESVMPVEGVTITAVVNVMPDGIENWNGTDVKLHIDLVAGAGNLTLTYGIDSFGVAKIKFDRAYTISYDMGDAAKPEDMPGEGETEPQEYIIKGEEVALRENAFTWTEHTFIGWKLEGDVDVDKVYYAGGAFEMPASDVIFHAQWLVDNHMSKSISGLTPAVPAMGVEIDPTTYSDFVINFSDAEAATTTSYFGFLIYFDLKNSDYNGIIPLTVSFDSKVLIYLTHSDILSKEGHNIFAGNIQSDSSCKKSFDILLDLDEWRQAGKPIIKNIDVYCMRADNNNSEPLKAKYNEKLSRYEWNASVRPLGIIAATARGHDTPFILPDDLLRGYTFTVHVKVSYPTPVSLGYGSGYYISNSKNGGFARYTDLTSENSNNEFTFEFTSSVGESGYNAFGFQGRITGDPFYSASGKGICFNVDAWAELKKDGLEKTLKPDTPYDGVKVKNGEPVEITLDPSIKASNKDYPGAEYYLDIAVTGATAPINIKYYQNAIDAKRTQKDATLDSENNYTATMLSFGSCKITLSTTSDTEQNISITLKKCVVNIIEDTLSDTVYTLPADKTPVNFAWPVGQMTAYIVLLDGDGNKPADNVVIKMVKLNTSTTSTSNGLTFTFNKDNNFASNVGMDFTGGGKFQLSCESGSEQKVRIKICGNINLSFSSSTSTSGTTAGFTLNSKVEKYFSVNSNNVKFDDYILHKFTLNVPGATKQYNFTLTYNGETAKFTANSNTEYTVTVALRKIDGNVLPVILGNDMDTTIDGCTLTLEYTSDLKPAGDKQYVDVNSSHMGDSEDMYLFIDMSATKYLVSGAFVTVYAKPASGDSSDLSGLKLKVIDANDGAVEIKGFTKGANEEWTAAAVFGTPYTTFRIAVYGVDCDVQLAFESVKQGGTVQLGEVNSSSFISVDGQITVANPDKMVFTLGDTIQKNKEYTLEVFYVNGLDASYHSKDSIKFAFTGATDGSDGELNITATGTFKVKFTADMFFVTMSGCAATKSYPHYFIFMVAEAEAKTVNLGENSNITISTNAKTYSGDGKTRYRSYTTFNLGENIKKDGSTYYDVTIKVNNADAYTSIAPGFIFKVGAGSLKTSSNTGAVYLTKANGYKAIVKFGEEDTAFDICISSDVNVNTPANIDLTFAAHDTSADTFKIGEEFTITLPANNFTSTYSDSHTYIRLSGITAKSCSVTVTVTSDQLPTSSSSPDNKTGAIYIFGTPFSSFTGKDKPKTSTITVKDTHLFFGDFIDIENRSKFEITIKVLIK